MATYSNNIPIWEKMNLTIKEASLYSNIGESALRSYIKENPQCDFIMYVGNKVLIKRKEFNEWNSTQFIVK